MAGLYEYAYLMGTGAVRSCRIVRIVRARSGPALSAAAGLRAALAGTSPAATCRPVVHRLDSVGNRLNQQVVSR